MTVMITGGSGFLGSALVRHLVLEQGEANVVVFDRYPHPGALDDVADSVTVLAGDVLQLSELVAAAHKYDVDTIAHMGSAVGVPEPDRIHAYVEFQYLGTTNVYETARILGMRRVVNASSSAIWTNRLDVPSREEDPPSPHQHMYAAHKLWSEQLADYYNSAYDMEILSMRPCGVFGYGRLDRNDRLRSIGLTFEQHKTGGGRPNFMANVEYAAIGKPVVMPPDDEVSDFLYVADAALAWWLALTRPRPDHSVFNLRSEQRPVGDMTRHLRKALPHADITVASEKTGLTQLMDNTRLVTELGFTARYTIESGIDDCLEQIERRRLPSRG
jgi:nucleoside-diphosphate-sugar epimerase